MNELSKSKVNRTVEQIIQLLLKFGESPKPSFAKSIGIKLMGIRRDSEAYLWLRWAKQESKKEERDLLFNILICKDYMRENEIPIPENVKLSELSDINEWEKRVRSIVNSDD